MRQRIVGALARFFDGILDITVWVAGLIIVIIMLMTVYEVVSRKLFGSPTSWAIDLSTLGLFAAALLPTAWVLKRKAHVGIEILSAKLNVKSRGLLGLITYSLALLACAAVVWQGIEVTLSVYQQDEMLFRSLVIPKVWYIWIFPLSFFLIIVQLLREVSHFYGEYKETDPGVDH
jgi:C4-dicarboxylate transporter, DctQ subunit